MESVYFFGLPVAYDCIVEKQEGVVCWAQTKNL